MTNCNSIHLIFLSMQVKERTFSISNMIFFTFNSQQYFKYFDFTLVPRACLSFIVLPPPLFFPFSPTPVSPRNTIRMLGRAFILVVLGLILNARGENSCRPATICCEESLRRCGGVCECIRFSQLMTRERVLRVQFAPE